MPKVSVIIPVYNVEKYLRQCLDSILNQTLREIEIICVDDGSTDSSYDILQEYAKKDSRFVILKQQNAGAGIARNTGMKIAKGTYLSILDSDDYFELDMLEKAYLQCEKYNADMCVFRSDRFDSLTGKTEPIPWTIKQNVLPKTIPFSSEAIYPYIFQIFNGWAWDKLYRREFVEQTGLKFQGLRSTNDAFFVFMATVQAQAITIVDNILAHHRENIKTSLSVTREKSWDCCWQAVSAIKQELHNRGQFTLVEQSFINWALHFLLWNVHTLEKQAQKKLIKEMKKNYFAQLRLSQYPKDFFYNQSEYREYLLISCYGKAVPLQIYLLRRIWQHFRENGVKSTILRILSKITKINGYINW